METKKQGICTTCHYQRNCSIKISAKPSWECSEYQSSTIFSSTSPVTDHTRPVMTATSSELKGLCSSCDARTFCRWMQPETIIFHCEHYQ